MRIALVHDVFRANPFSSGGQNRAAAFWQAQLAPVLAPLGHDLVRPAAFAPNSPPLLEQVADRHSLPRDRSSWISLFSDPALLPLVGHLLVGLKACDLVLGWELSPNIMRALTAQGMRFVNSSIDTIRFCPDVFLRVRTNDPVLSDRLAGHEVPTASLRAEARRLAQSMPPAPARPDSVLFAGQMEIDASLIAGAALARAAGLGAGIEALCAGRTLLLKPHPHCTLHPDIRALHAVLPGSRIVDDNVYALLAAPWLREVVTLSSSVADEAAMFDKPARRLVTPDWDRVEGVLPLLPDRRALRHRRLLAAPAHRPARGDAGRAAASAAAHDQPELGLGRATAGAGRPPPRPGRRRDLRRRRRRAVLRLRLEPARGVGRVERRALGNSPAGCRRAGRPAPPS